jgi:membrane protease YdiL (CAAX protease family)
VWQPLVGLGCYLLLVVVLVLGVTTNGLLVESVLTGQGLSETSDQLLVDVTPLGLLTTNLGLAALILAAVVTVLLVHRTHPGWLASVARGVRWGLLWRCVGLALVVVVIATFAGGTVAGYGATEPAEDVELVSLGQWVPLALVVLLTTPLQAAGEEVGFRGYPLQALGIWFRSPWPAIVVTSLAFAAAHGAQNPALFVDRLGFGLVAGWLVVRTGGLEASIALHATNNVVVFLLAAAFDQVDDALATTSAPWSLAVLDITQAIAFAFFADRLVRRMGLATRARVPA